MLKCFVLSLEIQRGKGALKPANALVSSLSFRRLPNCCNWPAGCLAWLFSAPFGPNGAVPVGCSPAGSSGAVQQLQLPSGAL